MIKKYLFHRGISNIEIYNTGEECINNIHKSPYIIIQDYELPGINGLDVLKKVRNLNYNTEFIFLSGQHSVKTAVDIMKSGATDYIVKDDVAKEFIVSRIKKIIYIKTLEKKKKLNRQGMIIFGSVLIFTWIIIILLLINDVLRIQ